MVSAASDDWLRLAGRGRPPTAWIRRACARPATWTRAGLAYTRLMGDNCVAHVPIFRGLTDDQQSAVAGLARPLHVRAGEPLYLQGARDAPLIVLHTGSVKLVRLGRDGKERVTRVLGPGDFSGEASLLTGARPDHAAVAVADTVACSFRRVDFASLLGRHPQIGLTMMGVLSQRLAQSQDLLDQVTSRPVGARLADYLLGLEAERHPLGLKVTLPLPKKDVASLLGTTPESLSRALAKLAERAVVQLDGPAGITILDADALELAAQE